MKKSWVTSVFVSILTASLFLAGCGSTNSSTGSTGETTGGDNHATASSLEDIKKAGKIRIGTEGTYAPFTFHDSSGKLTGFDVELASEIAKRIGVEAEFIESKWDGMFAGIDAGRFDIVVNQVAIREDRLQKYDFSDPYNVSKAVLLVAEDNQEIKSFADLKEKKAGQTLTSNLTEIAKQNGAEIVQTEGFNQAMDLLIAGRIDATVNDGLSFYDFKTKKPDAKVKVVAEHPDASKNGVMIKKGSKELVDAVNKALKEMQADGTYLKISEKYFSTDVSK
ncbi:amino acid ABC transporter substrate-binding protein [Brevibacillus daliensis]|uniref:amino acid ABC transporter substrate-binding protein n=1 Tax=Brevibacillus daliensis TaxID=2892995 RepID=UPI001E43832A|nr:amino acid ABC transporter substrate-binding protein [Brevibacillus daliensis]